MTTLTRCVFFALISATLFVSACKDDVDPNVDINNRLEGDWEVESFRVDGVEFVPASINSFDMEFDKQGPMDGEFQWDLTSTNGNSQRFEGDYEIENSGTEIDLEGDEMDIEIDGDELRLEGTIDGEAWEIRAERD